PRLAPGRSTALRRGPGSASRAEILLESVGRTARCLRIAWWRAPPREVAMIACRIERHPERLRSRTNMRRAAEPEDSRLRSDGAGHRAGPGSKDLGADI